MRLFCRFRPQGPRDFCRWPAGTQHFKNNKTPRLSSFIAAVRGDADVIKGKLRMLQHLATSCRFCTKRAQKYRSLIFLSLLFWKKARKTTQKARISSLCLTPKIPGKEGKNAQKSKEIPCNENSKEIQRSKERKIRVCPKSKRKYFKNNISLYLYLP